MYVAKFKYVTERKGGVPFPTRTFRILSSPPRPGRHLELFRFLSKGCFISFRHEKSGNRTQLKTRLALIAHPESDQLMSIPVTLKIDIPVAFAYISDLKREVRHNILPWVSLILTFHPIDGFSLKVYGRHSITSHFIL
jgi:hypothetical protein